MDAVGEGEEDEEGEGEGELKLQRGMDAVGEGERVEEEEEGEEEEEAGIFGLLQTGHGRRIVVSYNCRLSLRHETYPIRPPPFHLFHFGVS